MVKKLLPVFERLLSLLVVFLLLSATTMWSGRFLGKTWANSETQPVRDVNLVATPPTEEQLAQLGLDACKLTPRDSASWMVFNHQRNEGVVLSSSPLCDDIIGFAGPTPIYIYVDGDNVVQGITFAENDETPSFLARVEKGIGQQWNGLQVKDALEEEVDAVTGATYSSNSVIENVRTVLAAYSASDLSYATTPVIGWTKTIALLLVFLIGGIVSWKFRGKPWLRMVVLVLNVGVTGFWCGQFLSITLFRNFIENGADILLYLPTVVMLLVAVILPYFGHRNHYCLWMCPYGSLQELAWRLPLPKVKISAKGYKLMSKIRIGALMLLLFLLWMGMGTSLLDYEPFSAFIVTTASPVVIVLASVFVLVGIFVPHPWCRCLCPVGTLLEMASDNK